MQKKHQHKRIRKRQLRYQKVSPFHKVEFEIMFGVGNSKYGELIDVGVEHSTIQKSGT